MSDDRFNNNASWLNSKGEYDTNFVIPNEWCYMFDTISLSNIQQFILDELEDVGDNIPIYPPKHLVFNTFHLTPPSKLKVVILGQDPYINHGEAMGLAFSVPDGKKIPPSLRNIFKKLNKTSKNGDLSTWASQGVLLLNSSLTVKAKQSNSHSSQWKQITDSIIKYISDNFTNIIFILWGGNALKKQKYIDDKKHYILISSHPCPLGCTKELKGYPSFNNSNHFSKCNDILERDLGKTPIDF